MTLSDLYTAYSKQVFNLALHYTQNQQDAEEITQDVFLKVHEHMARFRAESSVKTWIYRITINQSLDFLKAKQRRKRFAFWTVLDTQNEPISLEHPGALLEQKETVHRIFRAMNQLPKQQRTVLILHKIEHLPQKEIALILGTSPKSIESLLQRAKKNLKNYLNQALD
jgi:RNA polymerase sigma-70 factor (family 1)